MHSTDTLLCNPLGLSTLTCLVRSWYEVLRFTFQERPAVLIKGREIVWSEVLRLYGMWPLGFNPECDSYSISIVE